MTAEAGQKKPGRAGDSTGQGGTAVTSSQPNNSTNAIEKQPASDPHALARAAIRAMLDGQPPNGTAPADCGPWADTLQALIEAHAAGQAPAVKRAFDALALADPALARLVASDPTPQHKPHDIPRAKVLDALGRGETGDAELIEALYSDLIAYDHSDGAWYLWAGHSWQPDRTGSVYRLVSNQIAARYLTAAAEARATGQDELEAQLTARARALHNRRRVENVLFLAARQPKLALTGEEWDREPWLLAVANGVIDLRSGAFGPGRPADYLRSVAPTPWGGLDALAPRWDAFCEEVFDGNRELIAFLRRLFGYGITALTREHVFPIFHGEGRNGKGTLLETLAAVLGDSLTYSAPADALMETKKSGDAPQPYVYAMRGKRLVWASESKEGREIDGGLMKQLTGGDTLTPRTLHTKPIRFRPTHLLLLLTNDKPHMPADAVAVWDRVLLVPFTQRFVDNPGPGEHQRDPALCEKLLQEGPGILAWLVRGCLEWQERGGLDAPATVRAATAAYRGEEDYIAQFMAECCVIDPAAKVRGGDLFLAYKNWATLADLPKLLGNIEFGKRMKKRFESNTKTGYVVYEGIGLAAKDTPAA